MASRSFDGNGLGAKHVVFLAMTSAGLAVVVFVLGVMVGRGVSIVGMVTGNVSASAGDEEPFAVDERPAVVAAARQEPSVAATEGAGLSYFQRLDEDLGPDLDARLAPAATAPATAGATGSIRGNAPAGSGGGYAIQVTTLRESAAAERMVQGLVEKGYPAFVVAPAPGVPVQVFRVRVGTYTDREEAERILRRLEGEESFKPWITR